MSIEIRPVGVTCQLKCDYCYEEKMREASGRSYKYDREKVLASAAKLGPNDRFSLFGGEALLLNLTDLEELLKLSFDRTGSSGLQTNGALITEKHIELFIKYHTTPGISLDGPDDLNDSRWGGTLEATRRATEKTHWAIRRLTELSTQHGWLLPSLIVTCHAGNCGKDTFPRFLQWFKDLDASGIRYVNLHLMEMDHLAGKWFMEDEELSDRLIELWAAQNDFTQLRFGLFDDVIKVLQGKEDVVCIWKPCDPWNTRAVHGIEHDGAPSHCSRTNKDGINWLPAEGSGCSTSFIGFKGNESYERQLALYVTPQEVGGCQGCPYWLQCYGSCPGTGEHNDWRYRTSHCAIYKRLFAEGVRRLRDVGANPIPLWSNRKELEERIYASWAQGQNLSLGEAMRPANPTPAPTGGHGDHYDTQQKHGDKPHGDHYDKK